MPRPSRYAPTRRFIREYPGVPIVLCAWVLAIIAHACAAVQPRAQPVDDRALAALADGAQVKRQIALAAGKAFAEHRISQVQRDEVKDAAAALEDALNRCRNQTRAYLRSEQPDAGALEAATVRVETARAQLVVLAGGLGLNWRGGS